MGSDTVPDVVVPMRTSVDRTLLRKANVRVADLLLPGIDRYGELVELTRDLLRRKGIKPVRHRLLLATIDQEYRMLKETVFDRTIPVLSRTEVAQFLAMLPVGVDEMSASAQPAITDEELSRRESIGLLRDAISLLEAGGARRPGLVLLRGGSGS